MVAIVVYVNDLTYSSTEQTVTLPHDPAHHARLSYTCGDETWHLLATEPIVVTVSPTVSRGEAYATPKAAEAAFWGAVKTLIQREFPDWRIWCSDAGCWYATRYVAPTKAQVNAGCAYTVDADTPEELVARLAEQERRTVAT